MDAVGGVCYPPGVVLALEVRLRTEEEEKELLRRRLEEVQVGGR